MAELRYSVAARGDLEAIGEYILGQLHNPSAALRVIRMIHQEIDRLRTFPEMGPRLDSFSPAKKLRYLVCGKYLAFYETDGDTVYIDRILYGRRNYAALLFDLDEEP